MVKKKSSAPKNTANIIYSSVVITIGIILSLWLRIISLTTYLIFVLFIIFTYSLYFFSKKTFRIEEALILLLTIILLDLTHPIFTTRIDVKQIEQPHLYSIIDGESYANRFFIIELTPPLIYIPKINCNSIYLGYDVLSVHSSDYIVGFKLVQDNGVTEFCTIRGIFDKTIAKVNVLSKYPLGYNDNTQVGHFWQISEQDNSTLVTISLNIFNAEEKPMRVQGNLSFIINNETTFSGNNGSGRIFNRLIENTTRAKCTINNFRLASAEDDSYIYANYCTPTIGLNNITLTCPIPYALSRIDVGNYSSDFYLTLWQAGCADSID